MKPNTAPVKLTKTVIDALTPPAKGQAFFWDSELKGFGVRIASSGVTSFILQKRVYGKDCRITLGRYGAITTKKARELARSRRAKWRRRRSGSRQEARAGDYQEAC